MDSWKEIQELAQTYFCPVCEFGSKGSEFCAGGNKTPCKVALNSARNLYDAGYRKIDVRQEGQRKHNQELEIWELAHFIGDHNLQKGSIDERYLPYVGEVARAIVEIAGYRKADGVRKETAHKLYAYIVSVVGSDEEHNFSYVNMERLRHYLKEEYGVEVKE